MTTIDELESALRGIERLEVRRGVAVKQPWEHDMSVTEVLDVWWADNLVTFEFVDGRFAKMLVREG